MRKAEALGDVIRTAREAAGMTQSELARRAELAANHVVRIEGGVKASPRFETIAKLAVALGLPLDAIARRCGYPALPPGAAVAPPGLAARLERLQTSLLAAADEAEVAARLVGKIASKTRVKRGAG